MNYQQHLKEIALLGVDKKELETNLFPEVIKEALVNKEFEDKESKYLHFLAYSHFYQEAGKQANHYDGEIIDKPLNEGLEVMDEKLVSILRKIMELNAIGQKALLPDFLKYVAKRRLIAPPDQMVLIIKLFDKYSDHRKEIVKIMGKKGKRVLHQIRNRVPKFKEEKWELQEFFWRIEMFREFRKTDPEYSIELLRSTWSKESVKFKKEILEIIKKQWFKSDFEFINDLYLNEFKYQDEEKYIMRECRNCLARTLLKFPNTALYRLTEDAFLRCLKSPKQSFLKKVLGTAKPECYIPQQYDDFWNPTNMLALYGISTMNDDMDRRPSNCTNWWLDLLGMAHVNMWTKGLKMSKIEVLHYFLNREYFLHNNENITKYPLQMSIVAQKDSQLSKAFLSYVEPEFAIEFMSLLDLKDWENYVINNKLFFDNKFIYERRDILEEWSVHFSAKFLENWTQELVNGKEQFSIEYLTYLACHFNVDILDQLDALNIQLMDKVSNYSYWTKSYNHLKSILEIRKNFESYKNQHNE